MTPPSLATVGLLLLCGCGSLGGLSPAAAFRLRPALVASGSAARVQQRGSTNTVELSLLELFNGDGLVGRESSEDAVGVSGPRRQRRLRDLIGRRGSRVVDQPSDDAEVVASAWSRRTGGRRLLAAAGVAPAPPGCRRLGAALSTSLALAARGGGGGGRVVGAVLKSPAFYVMILMTAIRALAPDMKYRRVVESVLTLYLIFYFFTRLTAWQKRVQETPTEWER